MAALKRGSKGDDVKKLQGGLNSIGFNCGTPDGIFGGGTEDAVDDFQTHHLDVCGVADGIVGKGTLSVYNPLVAAEFKIAVAEAPPPPDPGDQGRLPWTSAPCHKYKDGFSSTSLRADVAKAFSEMYAEVDALGGKLTSAGGKRPLSAGGGAAQSKCSMHYIGRAHDMALSAGMQDPTTDPCVIVRRSQDPNDRKWVIWFRTDNASVPVVTLQGIKCSTVGGKAVMSVVPVTGRFFNFTELAAKHGFVPISGRKKFFAGIGSYTMSEWWHFQYENQLVTGQTTFGSELLRVYNMTDAQKFIFWSEVKDAVWGEDFN